MKKNKTISIMMVVLLVISFSVSMIPQVGAADEGEIEASIVLGLEWLAGEQQADGRWRYSDGIDYDDLDIGTTGIVLLKFCDRAKELELDPFDSGEYEYADEVIAGFDYIFLNIIEDADGIHVDPLISWYEVYTTGCLMMAIASSNEPLRIITTGPLVGETYEYALQGMMDWMAFAQIDDISPCEEGGWGYIPAHYGSADNSVSGYATLGIGFAAAPSPYGFELTIPPAVLTELDIWIDIVQDDVNGGSWYRPCEPWEMINILKTGNLLYEMALVGDDVTDARVQNAIGYIEDHWGDIGTNPDFPGAASLGWMDCYQAMFTMMKGLVAFGITELDNGVPFDWFDEVSDLIIANQNPAGYFEYLEPLITEGDESPVLRTAWALLTLEKFIPPQITVTKDFRYTNVDWGYVYMDEDFSGDFPPIGWTTDEFYQSFTDYAGGTSPEATLYWGDSDDYSYLMSLPINTIGASNLMLEFKQYIDIYSLSGDTHFTVYSRAHDLDPWTVVDSWDNLDVLIYGPAIEMYDISYDIGSDTQIMFEFSGTAFDFDYWDIDDVKLYETAYLGGLLPMDVDGNYLVDVIVAGKHDKVKSTNPGQLYGVITITGPVHEVYIEDNFDQEFDINPAHIGGGIEIIIVDPDGFVEVITDYPGISASVWNDDPFNDALISIDLDTAIGGPLPPDHILMVYVKFQTTMKHEEFDTPYDNEFWNKPWIWLNNMEPGVDDPIELEAIIELSIK